MLIKRVIPPMKSLFRLLTELSSNKWLSFLAGKFAKSSVSRRFIPYFVRTYKISVEEAEKSVDEYATLNDFFVRRLKPDRRVVDPDQTALVSPVDGTLSAMGKIDQGTLLSIKGQDYEVKQLLHHSPRTITYQQGYYFVIYLSPSDYHRIHAPVTGKIVEKDVVAGKHFPVNEYGMRRVRHVLSRNARKITYLNSPHSEIALVKVGALNVSSICYESSLPVEIKRGDSLAYFEFGSTIVLLIENKSFFTKDDLKVGQPIRMGQALGYFVDR